MIKKLRVFFVLFFIIIVLGWYGFFFEPNNLKVEEIEVKLKNLPSSFEGARIILLSDFHSKNFGKKEKRVLEIVGQLKPDFVFLAGDLVDYTTKNLKSCQEFWRSLTERHKNRIYGVLGNHEHWNPNYYDLTRLLNESGIVILDNENKRLALKNDYIHLIGIDDPNSGYHNLEKAFLGVKDGALKILLAHSPEIIHELKDKKADLVLAGHTHGGQIEIPFIRPFWVPTKDHGKYSGGSFIISPLNFPRYYLYVTRGVGTGLLPIRFNCPPEITLIKLGKR